jgi:hypothetical protein
LDLDRLAGRSILERVVEQVHQDAANALALTVHGQTRLRVGPDGRAGGLRHRLERRHHLAQGRVEIHVAQLLLPAGRANARELQDVLHELGEALGFAMDDVHGAGALTRRAQLVVAEQLRQHADLRERRP